MQHQIPTDTTFDRGQRDRSSLQSSKSVPGPLVFKKKPSSNSCCWGFSFTLLQNQAAESCMLVRILEFPSCFLLARLRNGHVVLISNAILFFSHLNQRFYIKILTQKSEKKSSQQRKSMRFFRCQAQGKAFFPLLKNR